MFATGILTSSETFSPCQQPTNRFLSAALEPRPLTAMWRPAILPPRWAHANLCWAEYLVRSLVLIDSIYARLYTRGMRPRLLTTFYTSLTMIAFVSHSLLNRLALGRESIDAVSYTMIRLVAAVLLRGGIALCHHGVTEGVMATSMRST